MTAISDSDSNISRLGLVDLRDDRGIRLTNENNLDFKHTRDKFVDDNLSLDDTSSSDQDDDMNYFNYDDEQEFELIFNRICMKQKGEQTLKITLKYLYKLLKFYKLEHYMSDLVDSGFLSPVSLIKLKQNDLDSFNVSPYDKKKFLKLQLFLKQVTNTIKMTKNKNNNNNNNNYSNNNNKFSLNGDPNVDFKMFTFNEWKNMANSSSQSSSSNSKQNKITSDQFKNETNTNDNKLSYQTNITPIWTEINPKIESEQEKNMKRITKPSNVSSTVLKNTKLNIRAKSIEPQNLTKRGLSINPVSSKSSVAITTEPNSVTHPANNPSTKSASYFGPKLHTTSKSITNVELVNANNYNYGVPQNINTKNKGFIRKTVQVTNNKVNDNNFVNSNATTALVTSDIYVFARKRPKLQTESEFQDAILVDKNQNSGDICINEVKLAVDGTPILRKNEFNFDKTFDATYSNEEIFKSSILPFINAPFKARSDFNCVCFGQTGSGKTHTLFGNKQQDGLCVLTAESLFSNNERLFCGFYEIYNGQLYDLINRNNKLVLREDSSGQLNVVGLVEVEIKNIAHLRKTIELSQSNRHIGSTSFNKASSRSHAVIQFKVPNQPSSHASSGQVIMKSSSYATVKSKVNSGLHNNSSSTGKPFRVLFIDLAGSERGIDAQNNLNDNRKEGAEINQSLLALKECIRCIDQFRTHAPFRQSKLTRVLRDCFIGNGKTVLIATVSPTEDCVSCSINTLQYANRVQQMALRNRKRNEETKKSIILTKVQSKKITNETAKQSTRSFVSTQKQEEPKRKTFEPVLNAAIKNRSKSVINPKKPFCTEPKVKNLIKNLDDKKSLKYLITTSSKTPASSVAAAAVVAAVATVNATNVPTNNILESKPLAKSGSNTGFKTSSLFHPSKINCSSTPIKSVIKNDTDYRNNEDLLFNHDTPIKGHKIRLMAKSSSQMLELAERYFDKVNFDDQELKLATKFTNKIIQPSLSIYNSENDVLNSKIYSKVLTPRLVRDNNFMNDETKNEDDESGVESDELNKSIDKKSKLLNTEERLKLIYTSSPNKDQTDLTLNDDKLNRLRLKQREILETKKFISNNEDSTNKDLSEFQDTSSFTFNRKLNDTTDHLKNALDSQNQLRTYIRNLEDKLTNLRNEIKDQNLDNDVFVRKNSLDSNESFKDLKSGNRDVYSEFLIQRKQLERQQETLENSKLRRNSKLIDNEDEIERKFIENQLESSKSSNREIKPRLSSDDTLYSDNDAFEKSIHKGNNIFPKTLKKIEVKEDINKKCQFSPINQEENKDKVEPVLTPRTLLLNPIPIRLSSSSSSFESSFSFKNMQPKTDDGENLSPRLKNSNSKIWRTPVVEPDKVKNWSNILLENQKVETARSDKSNKNQLIVAHQNQLTDLSETCQKEMNLILSLKDSKVDFKDYLSQMEEMLCKKVNSIRDLQNQINQLKTEISEA